MPYTAWKYIAPSRVGMLIRNGPYLNLFWRYHMMILYFLSVSDNVQLKESETAPLLAIAWDHNVQVAKLVKSELKIHAKWSLESSAIGVAWLDDQVVLLFFS